MTTLKEIPPYYTQLQPSLPEVLSLSNVRIDKKIDMDHNTQLQSLKSKVDLFNDRTNFWIEASTLDRLHYKNMNQQRPFKRFQRGMEVRRLVKRIKSLAIDKELERLYLSFYNAKSLDKCKGNWNYIPSKESIQYTMHRLIATSLVLDKLKVTLLETYRANSTLLKLEHFVSLALVYMGICSRLYKLSHIWQSQIDECYHLLYQWSLCFPSGMKAKDEKKFLSSNNLHCEADTLKAARSKYAQDLKKLKSSSRRKVHLETYVANPANIEIAQEVNNEANESDSKSGDDMMDFEDLGEVIQR